MHAYNIPFPKNIMVKYRLYILPSKQSHKMEKGMDKTYGNVPDVLFWLLKIHNKTIK